MGASTRFSPAAFVCAVAVAALNGEAMAQTQVLPLSPTAPTTPPAQAPVVPVPQPAPPPVPMVVLKGIVFLPLASASMPDGWPALTGPAIDTSRVDRLNNPAFIATVQRYLGQVLDGAKLNLIRDAVSDYYKAAGFPFVGVLLPKQTLPNGVLQVLVIEGKLGKLSVEGNRWFYRGQYLEAIDLQPGDAIDSRELDKGLAQVNRNPFRHAQVVAAPGEAPGTTDITIRTQESMPLSVSAGIDNTGNAATGRTRMSMGVEWGNALWMGDDFSYHYTTSTDWRALQQHSASYVAFLPWADTLTLSGSVSRSNGNSSSLFSTTGRNSSVSLRYQINFPQVSDTRRQVTLGFDYKRANNDLLFGGTSVFPTSSDVDQFIAAYSASLRDSLGTANLSASMIYSPGGITGANHDAAFATQRAGATADYFYVRLNAEQLTTLPWGLSWDIAASAQWSANVLLSSETLGFGGFQSIRGFEEQTAVRDNGLILNNELRSPRMVLGLPEAIGLPGQSDAFIVYGFLDFGIGKNHDDDPAAGSSLTMISAGPGFTYQFGSYASLRFSTGFVLEHHGLSTGYPNRTHVGLQIQI